MEIDLTLYDVEARFDDERRQQTLVEAQELASAERTRVTLAGRLRAAEGREVALRLRGGRRLGGVVERAAGGWLRIGSAGGPAIVPMGAIATAQPLGSVDAEREGGAAPGITHALRGLAETGQTVVVDHDGGEDRGVIVAVYGDHLDLTGPASPLGGASASTAIAIALSSVRCVLVPRA